MAAATPVFQLAVSGPVNETFPSFPISELANGDVDKITLSNIRSKCNISSKLFFTVDGKTRLDDQTKLGHYMRLTPEGQTILQPTAAAIPPAANLAVPAPVPAPAAVPAAPAVAPAPAANPAVPVPAPAAAPAAVPAAPVPAAPVPAPAPATNPAAAAPAPGVPTFTIKVHDNTPAASAGLALPAENATLKQVLEQASKAKFLERGTLPTFTNTNLAALSEKYAAIVGTATSAEPADLTESDWDVVLRNNRVFHGYYTNFDKGIMAKAPRPAFRLRSAAAPGTPVEGTKLAQLAQYNYPIPPYYIYDKASVSVTEMNHQTQKLLVKESFNSLAVGGSIGGPPKIPISISASFDEEHERTNQKKDSTSVDSLLVTYNFPRVIIELESDCLELTPECLRDAHNASNIADVERFQRRYGTVYATAFTLGGYLSSTRNVKSDERANLEQVKDQTRKAAGLSVQSPKVSGSFGIASTGGKGSESGDATLHQDVRLTWDAHGGDTLLASNPPAWVTTVKDHKLWRLMDQRRVVQLFSLIMDVEPIAYDNLINPSPKIHTGKDPIKDKEYNDKIRTLIVKSLLENNDNNALLKRMDNYYQTNAYYVSPAWDAYSTFIESSYPDSPAAVIKPGVKYGGLTHDQKVYFGLFMAGTGAISFS